ncbi:hypothetical protein [Haloactinomyces albus]|uniref:SHOCT domain-containing protein n=1 Tax=Haloactinomyces albus TaxID=1352928 RepID=A0AAE4CND7_9ACTN|nr:hypothetical protein [Haloactinomyces albus]MDR7301932.1 hypothetical protein [Haloactinomyces albus]
MAMIANGVVIMMGKGASVTWQDELQHLDAELAAGRLSAEEYRQRRDTALGQAHAEQARWPGGDLPQQEPPQGPAQGRNPFPPAFAWDRSSGPSQQSPSQQPPPQQPPQFRPDQAGWAPYQPQPGWGPANGNGTPWGNAEFPPEHDSTRWTRTGPRVLATGNSSKGKLIAGLSLGGVLLAGIIVAGTLLFTGSESPGRAAAERQTRATDTLPEPPPATATPPATSEEALVARPPGPANSLNGALSPAALDGDKSGVLPVSVRSFALYRDMVGGWFRGTDGPLKSSMVAVRMPDEAAARKLVEVYLDEQSGMISSDQLSYRGVEVVTDSSAFRTAYAGQDWAVVISVRAVDASGQEARSLFRDLLERQLANLPPTT